MRGQQGFTLLELLITMSVAVIVIGWAAPTFSTMVQDNRLSGQSLDFLTSLNIARSEAIKRGSQVTLCKSSNGTSCGDKDSGNWEQGWIVFADINANEARDDGETVLRVHGALAGNNSLIGNDNVGTSIAYTARGSITQLGGTLALCDPRNDNDKGKAIIINSTGRARVTKVSESTMSCSS